MKTTCYVPGCGASLVGEAYNPYLLVEEAQAEGKAWFVVLDAEDAEELLACCPKHSRKVTDAFAFLRSVFGDKFTRICLPSVDMLLRDDRGEPTTEENPNE